MSNVMTLLRRELGQLFRTPLAYVFLILFVVLVQLPFLLTLFQARSADMRLFFEVLPWMIVIFAALVTMRLWAEERQENTYEMLLTFPMRDRELVLSKFLAAFLFIAIGIACTLSIPVLLMTLGNPDNGTMVSGYLGALLCAAMWCAAGVFFSGLTRSQLLAALVTFVFGMVSLFVGVDSVAALIDGAADGLGAWLQSMVGTYTHFSALSRGVVDLANVLFFVVWIVAFLYLNTLFVGWRRRPGSAPVLSLATAFAIGSALLAGRLLSETSLARADLTEDKLFTLSEGTITILKQADVPVRATYYVSPRDEMTSAYTDMEREVVDRLDEIRIRSGGMLQFRVVHMKAANLAARVQTDEEARAEEGEDPLKLNDEESVEKRLMDKGVAPFPAQDIEATAVTSKYIYSTLGISYREKDEELIAPLRPTDLPDIEYKIASTVARLVREAPARIALYLGKEPLDPQIAALYQQRGIPIPDPHSEVGDFLRHEKYDVVRTELTQHSPMPANYDAFIAVGPTNWGERERWELNRALASGKPVLLAVQRYTWDYREARGGGVSVKRQDAAVGIDDVLGPQGIDVSRQILMQDKNAVQLTVPGGSGLRALLGMPVKVPMHIGVGQAEMHPESTIVDRLGDMLYLWGTGLALEQSKLNERGFKVTTLVETTDEAWTMPPDGNLRDYIARDGQSFGRFPLVALIEGQFDDRYGGRERPKWPPKIEMSPGGRPRPAPPDLPETPLVTAPGKLLLAGSSRMWQNGIVRSPANGNLLLNSVAALTLDPALLTVRSKKPTPRSFPEASSMTALFGRGVPLVLVPLLIIAFGLIVGVLRMRARESWNKEHGR